MVAAEATAMKTPFPCRPDFGNRCLNRGIRPGNSLVAGTPKITYH